ncbi:MAG: hypothetical protein OXE75_13840, partial [bacterium]|nr:hypothetical protein [bacterium]
MHDERRLRDRICLRPEMLEPIAGTLQRARTIRGAVPAHRTRRRFATGDEHHPVAVTLPKPVIPPRQRDRPIRLSVIAALGHGLETRRKALFNIERIAHEKEPDGIRLGQERRR